MDNYPVDQTQDQTLPQDQPGSLGYVPPKIPGAGTEAAPVTSGPAAEATPATEIQPTVESPLPENLPPVETPVVSPPTTQPAQNVQQDPALAQQPTDDFDDHVVDKTDEITQLHSIQDTRDKLTAAADKEEEEFIKQVEAAHGDN